MKKYIVRLTDEERKALGELVAKGKAAAYKLRHAYILSKVDADGPNWPDARIAEAFCVHRNTVGGVRQRFVEQGLEAALGHKKRDPSTWSRKLDGKAEARLIALSCSPPPAGRVRWTLHLLGDRLVELRVVESVSHETVRQTLKKTN